MLQFSKLICFGVSAVLLYGCGGDKSDTKLAKTEKGAVSSSDFLKACEAAISQGTAEGRGWARVVSDAQAYGAGKYCACVDENINEQAMASLKGKVPDANLKEASAMAVSKMREGGYEFYTKILEWDKGERNPVERPGSYKLGSADRPCNALAQGG